MSNFNCNECGFNTLGAANNEPISDLTLSTMVVGNQEALLSRLIMVLLFLYAYTNQNFICYLMSVNEKVMCHQMCLTDKLVDNMMDNLANCQGNLDDCRRKCRSH
ncbi:hypothetical protein [Clostridium sp.]|uniref:hypothetical protein n=1 Tax=Clostridium sp. TaxID=1506 RepID=UPI00284795E5|nr:hypothetical protein [Clostridium sp.]MDR3595427.1 hypothetical protein [Clostridium sp.]